MQAKHDRPEGRGSSALGLAFLQMQNAAKRTIASAAPSPFHPRGPFASRNQSSTKPSFMNIVTLVPSPGFDSTSMRDSVPK